MMQSAQKLISTSTYGQGVTAYQISTNKIAPKILCPQQFIIDPYIQVVKGNNFVINKSI